MSDTATGKLATVIVIAGGLSHEREVSLRSGRRISQALREVGHRVIETDIDAELIALLQAEPEAVVVPMLHGGLGEDGALREALEVMGVPFVGADGAASRLTFDKSIATPTAKAAGIRTPRQLALPHDIFKELGAKAIMTAIGEQLGFPLMVKPARSGSALGTSKVDSADQLPGALVAAFAYGQLAVIEQFITGTEVAVTVLQDDEGVLPLPPVEIRPSSGVYDYEARYTAGATRFVIPAELPIPVLEAAGQLAVATHQALGLRHLSRSDIIIDAAGQPYLIEANVAPGMTETSLAPLAIEAAGLELGQVFSALVTLAARG